MKKHIIFRNNKVSFIKNKSSLKVIGLFAILALIILFSSLMIGENFISPLEIMNAFLGKSSKLIELSVFEFRMPRIIVGFLVGSALAISGAMLQGVTKNSLASPNVLGIVSGGTFGILIYMYLFTGAEGTKSLSVAYKPIFTLIGSLIAVGIIYSIAVKNKLEPFKLILIGIAISSAVTATTTLFIIKGPPGIGVDAHKWISGSINGVNWIDVNTLVIWNLIFLPFAFYLVRELNVQNLDDEVVVSLGSDELKSKKKIIFISSAIASGAVAIGGSISFIGLVAPHISRRLAGNQFGSLLTLSGLIGGILVVCADIIAKTIVYPIELPAGIFTSLIGAPFFIYLLKKGRKTK